MTSKAKKPAKAKATLTKAATAKPVAKKAKPTKGKAPAGPNPLLERWTTPFEVPPFDKVRTEHFLPAIEKGFTENLAEIAAIANNRAAPTFANTIDALEGAGRLLDRVSSVFFNLSGTDTTPEIQAIEREVAPRYAKHSMGIYQNAKLFARVDALMKDRKKLGLTLEQMRVLERYHRGFVKAGANLDKKAKARMAKIAERSATLGTQFGQNVLADEQDYLLVLDSEADLAGLPDAVRAAAAQTATDRGKPGKHAITLSRSSIEPFLQYSARRDLREKAFKAWIKRGAKGGKTDNRAIVKEMLGLRAERAQLLGYKTAADSTLEFSMAKTPAAVRKLLMDVWGAGAQAGAGRARPAAEGGAVRGRQLQARRLGLAPLRREGAQGALRRRRSRDQALPAARQRDRCGLRRGRQAVRRDLQGAQGPARLSPGRARLRGARQGRQARRAVLRRLLRAAVQALGRLDVGLARPVQARRRGDADRRQRHELRQGCAGRAVAAQPRRCAHAVPRVRARPARPAVERDLSGRCREPASSAISWSCPRSSTSIGWSGRRCCASSPSTTRPARRCRRRS